MFPKNSKPFIQINRDSDGNFHTAIHPYQNVSTIDFAVALASATRVFTEVLLKEMKLQKFHGEQIQAQIAQIYNHDLELGDLGEEGSTRIANDIE